MAGYETRTCHKCKGSGQVYCGRDKKGNSVWTTCGLCSGAGQRQYPKDAWDVLSFRSTAQNPR